MADLGSLFGMTVIESSALPKDMVMLRSGRMLYAWNVATGEVRKMEIPDFVMTPLPASPVTGAGDHNDGEEG